MGVNVYHEMLAINYLHRKVSGVKLKHSEFSKVAIEASEQTISDMISYIMANDNLVDICISTELKLHSILT